MSKPISVPVLTSKGEVWYSGEKIGIVERVPDSRYWAGYIIGMGEYTKFASRKAAIGFLVARADLGDLKPDHFRRFGTSRATGSLAPMAGPYLSQELAQDDPQFDRAPQAILACREVWVNDEPRILVHHPKQGPCTYEGLPGFRPLDPKATIRPRTHYMGARSA